jgi:hypothetical protein
MRLFFLFSLTYRIIYGDKDRIGCAHCICESRLGKEDITCIGDTERIRDNNSSIWICDRTYSHRDNTTVVMCNEIGTGVICEKIASA